MTKPDILLLIPKSRTKKLGDVHLGEHKERIADLSQYNKLKKIKNWREMLLNNYISPFVLDGMRWNTVEHYYQGAKFRDPADKLSYKFFQTFSLDSDSKYNEDVKDAKNASFEAEVEGIESIKRGSMVNFIKPRSVSYIEGDKAILKMALFAKFTQNEELKMALLSTNNAELYIPESEKSKNIKIWHELMIVRLCIRFWDSKCDLSEVSKLPSKMIDKVMRNPPQPRNSRNKSKQTPGFKDLREIIPEIKLSNNQVIEGGLHSNLVDIISKYVGNPFIVTVNIIENIVIPEINTNSGVIVDWGDGNTQVIENSTNTLAHKYKEKGRYIITIHGDITNINFSNVNELMEISQWGEAKIDGNQNFYGCENLIITAVDAPDLSDTTELKQTFGRCFSLEDGLSNWDVSNITSMRSTFFGCKSLNTDLSKWNVSNVTSMILPFFGCKKFNSDLSGWDVSRVQTMHEMFLNCKRFNQNLNNWDVSSVTTMDGMFEGCKSFNGNISDWDTKNVSNMSSMFSRCNKFNGDLSRWNVKNVTHMNNMFYGCTVFNGDLSKWNVKNVTQMNSMFFECVSFNSDISKWNVKNVTQMNNMFYGCTVFNSDLSRWNVRKVVSMSRMFMNCKAFNSDLSRWNTKSLRIIYEMFEGCDSFTGNINILNRENLIEDEDDLMAYMEGYGDY